MPRLCTKKPPPPWGVREQAFDPSHRQTCVRCDKRKKQFQFYVSSYPKWRTPDNPDGVDPYVVIRVADWCQACRSEHTRRQKKKRVVAEAIKLATAKTANVKQGYRLMAAVARQVGGIPGFLDLFREVFTEADPSRRSMILKLLVTFFVHLHEQQTDLNQRQAQARAAMVSVLGDDDLDKRQDKLAAKHLKRRGFNVRKRVLTRDPGSYLTLYGSRVFRHSLADGQRRIDGGDEKSIDKVVEMIREACLVLLSRFEGSDEKVELHLGVTAKVAGRDEFAGGT